MSETTTAHERAWLRVVAKADWLNSIADLRPPNVTVDGWLRLLVRALGRYERQIPAPCSTGTLIVDAAATLSATALRGFMALTGKTMDEVEFAVLVERARQDAKFVYPRPHSWSDWLIVWTEEIGEFAQALNDTRGVHDMRPPAFSDSAETELLQVLAVGVCVLTHHEDGHV